MDDKKLTIPLMVRYHDDIQFVEEDNDTAASDNEPSTGTKKNSESKIPATEHVYNEIAPKDKLKNFLGIPQLPISRSTSTESYESAMPMLVRSSSGRKKQNDYEKISVASATSKKSTVERIADGTFFRRRNDLRSDKGEDEEHILEALRHIVRKCTSIDPMKRPSSEDVMDLLCSFNEKS